MSASQVRIFDIFAELTTVPSPLDMTAVAIHGDSGSLPASLPRFNAFPSAFPSAWAVVPAFAGIYRRTDSATCCESACFCCFPTKGPYPKFNAAFSEL
jgi:hypothetical protein